MVRYAYLKGTEALFFVMPQNFSRPLDPKLFEDIYFETQMLWG